MPCRTRIKPAIMSMYEQKKQFMGENDMKKIRNNKKYLLITVLLVCLAMIVMTGCGSSAVQYDDNGNASITSKWHLVQFTVNGETTVVADQPWWIKVMFRDKNPAFSSSDGISCVFSNNGKPRNGRMSFSDGVYHIAFSDTKVGMEATITGSKMVLVNDKGTLELIFEAR